MYGASRLTALGPFMHSFPLLGLAWIVEQLLGLLKVTKVTSWRFFGYLTICECRRSAAKWRNRGDFGCRVGDCAAPCGSKMFLPTARMEMEKGRVETGPSLLQVQIAQEPMARRTGRKWCWCWHRRHGSSTVAGIRLRWSGAARSEYRRRRSAGCGSHSWCRRSLPPG